MKETIKKALKNSALGRIIYEPLHRMYRLYSVPHRRRVLRKNGVAVLKHLADVFSRYEIPAYATYGTLLGFVRDSGFIPTDDDVDVGILPGEWTPSKLLPVLLNEEGFDFVFAFSYEGRVSEFKLFYLGVPVDFFFYDDMGDSFKAHAYYYFPSAVYPNDKANTAKMIVEPRVTDLKKIDIFGMEFPVPSDSERVLAQLYGADWRIPNGKWDDSMHPTIVTLPGFGYSVSKEDVLAGW